MGVHFLRDSPQTKKRISLILSLGIAVCWSYLSISEATLKPNLPLLSLWINTCIFVARVI